MLDEQKELLRNAILLQLEAADPASLPLRTLRHGIRVAGHDIADNVLLKQLSYLKGKHLLEEAPKTISKTVKRYRLTATGRDYLEEQGLA